MVPYGLVAFAVVAWVAATAGWDDWPTRIAFGAAGTAISVMATTDYRVLARTTDGLALFKASRIRQIAKSLDTYLEADEPVEPVGGTMLAADWQVGRYVYTVPRSSEQAMKVIAS
jgi:hypothetical protein